MFKIINSCTSRNLIKNLCLNQQTKTPNKFFYLTYSTNETSNNADNADNNKENKQKQTTTSREELNEDQIKELILTNALKHVPNLGFSNDALSQGAVDAGYSAAAQGMFTNREFDLIDYFYKSSNRKLAEYLESLVKEGKIKKKNEFIRSAIVYRLGLIQPYINQWPQAMAIATFNPSYALTSIENLLRLCDEIWHQAGDTSTDLNWYTKRLTLAAIYKSTELFMIQDKSESFKDTYEFLDNRFNDLIYFNRVNTQLSNFKDALVGSVTVMKKIIFNARN